MSSPVKITIRTQLSALVAGIALNYIAVTLVDAAGNSQSKNVLPGEVPAPDADGRAEVDVLFNGVFEGDFEVTVAAIGSDGNNIGAPIVATDTVPSVPGMAQLPVSILITLG